MTLRLDNLEYSLDQPGQVPNRTNLFFDGPSEFLVKTLAKLLAQDSIWTEFFGDRIDPYDRFDYSIRELPALKIYNYDYIKEFESWFINGDIKVDVVFPASIRRNELQQLQDTLSTALLQQFRRPEFFTTVESIVAGLNELGKRFSVDKKLGMMTDAGQSLPMTQITLNFRIDLRQWDNYLEATDRTKDSPFSPVIGDLRKIMSQIQALNDDETKSVTIGVQQQIVSPPSKPQIF